MILEVQTLLRRRRLPDRHRVAAPEYWWAYALLLSTTIPSLVNLAIGGMALTRGIPWLARLLLQWIPEGKASR